MTHNFDRDVDWEIVTTGDRLEQVAREIQAQRRFCWDTETSGRAIWFGSRIVGHSFAWRPSEGKPRACYIPCRHKPLETELFQDMQQLAPEVVALVLKPILEGPQVKVGHNLRFDMHHAAADGILVAPPFADTIVACKLIDERWWSYALDACVRHSKIPCESDWKQQLKPQIADKAKRMGGSPKAWVAKYGYQYLTIPVVGRYAAQDATYNLWLAEWAVPQQRAWGRIWNMEMALLRVLVDMERIGVPIDQSVLVEIADREKSHMADLAPRIYGLANCEWELTNDNATRKVLFGKLGYEPAGKTPGGDPSVDDDALWNLETQGKEIAKLLRQWNVCQKIVSTYTLAIVEQCDPHGILHTEIDQMGAKTGRVCVAKGTPIQMPCNRGDFPDGKPIEEVRAGDLVYSYNHSGQLFLKKVLWAGQTGVMATLRICWQGAGHRHQGELLLTPDHEVRLVSGRWKKAKNLKPGDRVMSLHAGVKSRDGYFHLYPRLSSEVRENVFIGQALDMQGEVIHHKDECKLNNNIDNLEGKSLSAHAHDHGVNCSEEVRRFRISVLARPDVRARSAELSRQRVGPLSPNWKAIPRSTLLRWAAMCKGQIRAIIQLSGMDFNVLQREFKRNNLNLKSIRRRYGADGRFISYHRLLIAAGFPQPKCFESLSVGFYAYKRLLEDYGLANNHEILSVESGPVVPVYDLEIEDTRAFIASEICVHNSSRNPNLQNIPIRTELGRQVRRAFIARPGKIRACLDYSQIELRMIAHLTQDPLLLKIYRDNLDAHSISALEAFGTDQVVNGVDMRRVGKILNFGTSFGMTADGLLGNTNKDLPKGAVPVTRAQAEQFVAQFHAKYKGVQQYKNYLCYQVSAAGGQFRDLFGRPRHMGDGYAIGAPGWKRRAEERATMASMVQGSTASLVKFSMVAVWRYMREQQICEADMVLMIHDDCQFDLGVGHEKLIPELKRVMEQTCQANLSVPIKCDVEWFDTNWAEKKKLRGL